MNSAGGLREDQCIEDQTVREHAQRILEQLSIEDIAQQTAHRVEKVIDAVFADEEIPAEFQGAKIRCTAMRGDVARAILTTIGESPDNVIPLSIGDVTLPEFARETIQSLFRRAYEIHEASAINGQTGYDVAAKGSEAARKSFVNYMDGYYRFSEIEGLKETLATNCCVTNGGMEALHYIADTLACQATDNGKKWISIQPDNSFGTWFAIAKRALRENGDVKQWISMHERKLVTLKTLQKDSLHLTAKQVDDFYKKPRTYDYQGMRSWYITPVGNPSGTCIKPDQLKEVCEAIVKNDPGAVIILDCVYVRTLPKEKARRIMEAVIKNPTIRNRVIFIESFSKTHGVCGERVGAFFSANPELFNPAMNTVMVDTAGMPRFTDAEIQAFSEATPEQNAVIKRLHEFWADERRGLYNYLIKRVEFADLFDEDQSHITPDDIENPAGLYILLKLKPGVDQKQVLLHTKCLGVETEMLSGDYMRFSVGKITEPTYAKYATT